MRWRLERLTDELLTASTPPEKLLTREEARANVAELGRRHEQRQHQRRLAEIRAASRQAAKFHALARDLEAACRGWASHPADERQWGARPASRRLILPRGSMVTRQPSSVRGACA